MHNPFISVVINNYNYADYVGAAIESVLAQTCGDVECIVVDDGSTDESRAVIGRYDGIKPVFKTNGGQLSAVRAGFEQALGEIVIFLDSDDSLYPKACSEIAAAWRPGLSLLQFGLDKKDNAGKPLGTYPNGPFIKSDHIGFLLRYGYIPSSPMSGNAFSRNYLAELFAMPAPDERMAADGYLIYCAPVFGEVAALERALGCYRVHGGNTSPSAIVSPQTLQRQLLNDIKFRERLAQTLERRGFAPDRPLNYLGPYDFRTILLLNRGYRNDSSVRHIGCGFALVQAIRKFLTYPDIPLGKRVRNVAGVLAIAALPPAFVRRLLPEQTLGSSEAWSSR